MRRLIVLVSLAFLSTLHAADPAAPIPIGDRRELFVDDHLIDKLAGGAALRLHHPEPREIALLHDAPWEGSGSGYHSVFHDGSKYRMYYKAWHLEVAGGKFNTSAHPLFCCYAESDDGIRWRKPELGLHRVQRLEGKQHRPRARQNRQREPRSRAPRGVQGRKSRGGARRAVQGAHPLEFAEGAAPFQIGRWPALVADERGAGDHRRRVRFAEPRLLGWHARRVSRLLAHLHRRRHRRGQLETQRPSRHPHRHLEGLPALGKPGRPALRRFPRRAPLHEPGEALSPRAAPAARLPYALPRARLVRLPPRAA